jgi:integration host factor subunit alpha
MAKTLTKQSIVETINKKIGFSKSESTEFVNTVVNAIISEIKDNEDLTIKNFGSFKVLQKKERPGRDFNTGKVVTIGARKVVSFKPSVDIKNKLNKKR